jgi:hypothetical protein
MCVLPALKGKGGYMRGLSSIYQPDSMVDAANAAISLHLWKA